MAKDIINDTDYDKCLAIKEVLEQLSDDEVIKIFENYADDKWMGNFWDSDNFGNLALVKEDLLDRNGIFEDYSEEEIKELINNEESNFNPKDKWLLYEETMLGDGEEVSYIETYPTALKAIYNKFENYDSHDFLSREDYENDALDMLRLIETIVYDNKDYGNKKVRECLDSFNKNNKKGKEI